MTKEEAAAIQDVRESVDDLTREMKELRVELAGRAATEAECRKRCDKHEESLYGNGKIGLTARIEKLTISNRLITAMLTVAIVLLIKTSFYPPQAPPQGKSCSIPSAETREKPHGLILVSKTMKSLYQE